MKLAEKIRLNKIVYLAGRRPAVAFKLAVLYFLQAKRQTSFKRIITTCCKSIYWLKVAGVSAVGRFALKNPLLLLNEIEEVLVKNRTSVVARTS